MQAIVDELLGSTNARGVWLMSGDKVIAAATADTTLTPPRVRLGGELWIELGDTHLFAQPIGSAMLVVVFDDRTSYGLIRLRVRNVKDAIERALG